MDNNDENYDEYFEYLPADHPLYNKMQQAIEEQLKKEEESLRLLHKEKSGELRKIKRMREDIGINLYACQQRYNKLEEENTRNYEEYTTEKQRREGLETMLHDEERKYNEKFASVRDQQRLVSQSLEELNQLNIMLKYVEDYNLEVESEIKVTSTTGHVVEKKIKEAEREKNKQDFFIDYLSEQIKNLTEKKLLFEAQLKSQKEETRQAKENLSEAQNEIENIMERKRNLLKDWDKSLISMKTRDKALQVVRDNIAEQDGEKLKYTSQISRYNDLIQSETYNNNNLQHEMNKVMLKLKVVENQISEINMKKNKLDEKRLFINSSIGRTKDEIHSLDIKESNISNDIEVVEKNKIKLLNEICQLDEKNFEILSSKETLDKQTENLYKLNNQLQKDIFDVEVEIDSKENEIARVNIDHLNVETQNGALQNKKDLMDGEIKKLEEEYKDKNTKLNELYKDLKKKQHTMDKLNKDYGRLTDHKGGEDEGEFEIIIKGLKSEINNLNNDIQSEEDNWIKEKSELVKKESKLNGIREECTDKRSKLMILDHKKKRQDKNYDMHVKEIKETQTALDKLNKWDMEKYNSLLGKNMNSKEKLEHKIFDVEIQFKEKLKQLENESVKLELEIEVLREEKSDTLTQILEVERQIHLWERKIQLEEKMQEIIKPDKGLKEIDKIKTELHVQDLKYKKLKQDQEKVIKSMEMAIQRRDFIKIRYPGDKSTSKVVSGVTTMKKQIDDLRDHLKHLENKTKQNTSLVQTTRKELNKVNSDLESINIEVKRMQDNISQCKDEFAINKILANNFAFNAKYLQDATKDIEDIQKKKIRNRDTVLKETENIVSETEMLKNILINFSNTNPEYEEIINVALEIDKI